MRSAKLLIRVIRHDCINKGWLSL